MIPQTVPNSPMNGAVEPTVARSGRPFCSPSASLAIATSIDRSIRLCAPAISRPSSRWLRCHSVMPDENTRSDGPFGVSPIFS